MESVEPVLTDIAARPALPATPRRAAASATTGTPSPPAAAGRRPRTVAGDLLLMTSLAGLVGGAWLLSRRQLFRAGDDIGYWLGVAGGVMMLLLFAYPLRKHVKRLHGWGKVKTWFWVHMGLGIAGPLLILLHSTFRVGSLNAAMALFSMAVVVGSGVVGRFLYVRVNRGLHDEQATLRRMRERAGLTGGGTRSLLNVAPGVQARLALFERRELGRATTPGGWGLQVLTLPLRQRWVERTCTAQLKDAFDQLAATGHWTWTERNDKVRRARHLVQRHLAAVARVARSDAYARLFALWHVAHVPFVVLLALSAVAHVFAVHAY